MDRRYRARKIPLENGATIKFNPENGIVEFNGPSKPGQYVLQFYSIDGSNNTQADEQYYYTVADEQPPVLSLIEDPNNDDVPLGGTYVDPGATWTDNVDEYDDQIIYSADTIDTSIVGPQTIKYTKTDSAGNTGEITRTVTVVAPEPFYQFTLPSKKDYKYGEELDLSDAQILYISERGVILDDITVEPSMFSDFSTTVFNDISNITENKQALFKYDGKLLVYDYTVTQSVTEVEVSKNSN